MRLVRTSPPAELPVSLEELKDHLREDSSDLDADLSEAIAVATQVVEEYTGRALVDQTWKLYLDAFEDRVRLPWPPLLSVESIEYVDPEGATQTLDAGVYDTIEDTSDAGIVRIAYGATWPSTRSWEDVVTITYRAGYGDAEDVPARARRAVKIIAADYYEHPQSFEAAEPGANKVLEFAHLGRALWPLRELRA